MSEKLNSFESTITHMIPEIAPHKIPAKIEKAFSLKKENFLYKGNAKATVAGAKKKRNYLSSVIIIIVFNIKF